MGKKKKLLSETEFKIMYQPGLTLYNDKFAYRIVTYIGKTINTEFEAYIDTHAQYLFFNGKGNSIRFKVNTDKDIIDIICKCEELEKEFDDNIQLKTIELNANTGDTEYTATLELTIEDNREIIDTLLRLKGY